MNLYRSFTDEEIIQMTKVAYDNAKNMSKEGVGTHRNAGDCGRGSNEWIDLASECKKRGLTYK